MRRPSIDWLMIGLASLVLETATTAAAFGEKP